jgi:lipoyl(octanoyl) transferase
MGDLDLVHLANLSATAFKEERSSRPGERCRTLGRTVSGETGTIRAFNPLEPAHLGRASHAGAKPCGIKWRYSTGFEEGKARLTDLIEIVRRKADVLLMKLDPDLLAPSPGLSPGAQDTRAASGGTGSAAQHASSGTSAPFGALGGATVEWMIAEGLTPYEEAVAEMEARAAAIAAGRAAERVWLVEHPALYTAGTSARAQDLIEPLLFPVFKTGRGGQFTYHGPGQRVAYVMLDLNRRKPDLRAFVHALEAWIITTLWAFNIRGERREGRVGVWVPRPEKGDGAEDKIAAIGIRVRRWVSFHGISINVEPDLSHYAGIVPCGITGYGVTSLTDLGWPVTMPELDAALRAAFEEVFGKTRAA